MARKDASIWRYIKDWLRQRHWQERYWALESQVDFYEFGLNYYRLHGTPSQQQMALALLDDLGK